MLSLERHNFIRIMIYKKVLINEKYGKILFGVFSENICSMLFI